MQVPGRRDECEKCRADVHVCRNCRHYDPKSYNECREPQADRIQEKSRANFCDFFLPGTASGGISEREKQKAAAEALFKKK
ncbi:MAG: hypothetical protein J0L82_13220 [Deltaproteobacteria bacterium]|nr:hypothetical protein [Deltaproteobacteria bacterium]